MSEPSSPSSAKGTRTLYPPLWESLQRALADIMVAGYAADKVIQRQFKFNRKWGSHDRRLFAESVYDIVRWWRRLLHVSGIAWPKSDVWTENDAKVFARVTEAWCHLQQVELGRNIARSYSPAETAELAAKWNDPGVVRAVRGSIPDWLDRWGETQHGERWGEVLPVLNTVAPVYLRANRLKVTAEKLIHKLAGEKIACELVEEDCLRLKGRCNLFLTESFRSGLFEVQDCSSQKVAPFLAPQPGERVIDACAGAGGKSLHIAALMRNKGRLVSLDVDERKLEALRERSTRAGATTIETRFIESKKLIKRLGDSADRLLLDVPCSGLGVWRRNPDSKWKLRAGEVEHILRLQSQILSSYPQMLKAGGTLVYATCSIMPEENEKQVEAFLSQNAKTFELVEQRTLWPESGGPDGFFMARLHRRQT